MKFACMKLESLVIADQNAVANTFPGLVHTARHAMEVGSTQSHRFLQDDVKGKAGNWGEVVTR